MRSGPDAGPGTGNAAASRGVFHSGSDDIPSTSAVQPMTRYFMATEDALDRMEARGLQPPLPLPLPLPLPYSHPHRHSQKYGVDLGPGPRDPKPKPHHRAPPSVSECTSISWPSPSMASQPGLDTPPDLSRPMTPVLIDHCQTESATSSLSSPRSSYAASPALPSRNSPAASPAASPARTPQSGSGVHPSSDESLRLRDTTTVPQFIMPSVRIPRRRPFSDEGKALGKLKILVTGQAGLGKTSLISSIAQSCQHIVHMDPIVPTQRSRGATEIYASTRPCPWWQAESEPSNGLMRRRSLAPDEILDRNLCFVDCSGAQTSQRNNNVALGYVDAQLSSLLARPMNDEDLWKLLNSGTEPIVDVVLYLLPHTGPKSADIAAIKALQGKTNVITLLARVDELVAEQAARSQLQVEKILQSQDIDYFSFAVPGAEHASSDVYAVSNNFECDKDVMDASLLMDSEYERPLLSTDLQRLVGDLLSPDGCARLRHSASSKCVSWRRRQPGSGLSSALTKQLTLEGASISPPPFIGHLTARQQYWRRIEMGSWAESLRQSLTAERRGETPLLLESGEMVSNTMLLARVDLHEEHAEHERRGERRRRDRDRDRIPRHQDPLGLVGLAVQLKCNGRQTIELLSSASVVGYLAAQFSDRGILPKW